MHIDLIKLISNVGRSLSASKSFPNDFNNLLKLIGNEVKAQKMILVLMKADTDMPELVASYGLDPGEFRKLDTLVKKGAVDFVNQSLKDNDTKHFESADFNIPSADSPANTSNPLVATAVIVNKRNIGMLAIQYPSYLSSETITPIAEFLAALIGQNLIAEQSVRGEREKLREENIHLKSELKEKYGFSQILGKSGVMNSVYEQVKQVATSNATVLLRGESGTGKELISNAIHYNSLRSKRPFIKLNCAALPESLIESELFGHERGAFTGADKVKKGRFEVAEGGTLFLDEIGDIPPQTQVKLLRVLQEREFERLGSSVTIKANIRIIAATNKDLEAAISQGQFREDLYYRLNVFSIFVPPLRQRKADILLLAEHFIEKYEAEHGKQIKRLSTSAIDMLMAYHFPGNVRELENAIERAVIMCDSNVIHSHHLPPSLQTAEESGTLAGLSLEKAVETFEKDMIQDALKTTSGNIAAAARQLDTTQRILGYKIAKYHISPDRFRK